MNRSLRFKLRAALAPLVLACAVSTVPMSAAAQQAGQDGERASRSSRGFSLASSEEVEQLARQQYAELKKQAAAQGALAPADHPTTQRVRRISERLIVHAPRFNERAAQWQWEVNVIGSKQVNAFCMPAGKIAVFTGLIDRLRLNDDELAMVIGHEMAHALLEHGRERVGKTRASQLFTMGASVLSQVLGYGDLGGLAANAGGQLLLLKYGREDETESDQMGMEIAARAGFDPRAALTLWQKMAAVTQNQSGPPQFLSTHPSHSTRTRDIQAYLPKVLPLYAQATGRSANALPAYGSTPSRDQEALRGVGPRGAAPTGNADDAAGSRGVGPRGMQ